MLYELHKVNNTIETAFMGAMNEFLDRRKDLLPPTFQPPTGMIDDYARYCEQLDRKNNYYVLYPMAIMSTNTSAVVGLASIRSFRYQTCKDRQDLGDVEIAIRPTQYDLGFEEDIVSVVFDKCMKIGLNQPIVTINHNFTKLYSLLTAYEHKYEHDFEHAGVKYKRMTVVLKYEPNKFMNNEETI